MASQAVLELLVQMKDEASAGLSSIGGALSSLGGVALGVGVAGFAALGAAVVSGIGDAREAALIMAQTENVITSTGNAAGVSAQHVADYAASLSAASGASLFGDSQIQESTNLLLTFTNIKSATLDAATAISVDMAQALGGAPKDAAIQLGKALNDPIAGISALSRVGVSFTEEQKATIKTMQEAGDVAGAQAVILAELNKEFGGSAAAAAAADGGIAQFKDILGETAETVGALILPMLNTLFREILLPGVQTLQQVVGALTGSKAAFDGLSPALQGVVVGLRGAVDLFMSFLTALRTGDFGPFVSKLQAIGAQIGPVFLQLATKAAEWIGEAIPPFLVKAAEFARAMIGWVVSSLPGWVDQLKKLAAAAIQWIIDALPGLGTNLGKFAGQVLSWIVQLAADVVPKLLVLAGQFLVWVATEVVPKLPGVLLTIATAIYNFITGVVREVEPKLVVLAQEFLTWVATEVVPKIPGELAKILTAISTWIGATVTWAGTELAKIGAAIVAGIQTGISNAWDTFLGWIGEQTAKIPEPIRTALGISSPSTVMAEIGGQIVEGLVVGVSQAQSDLTTTMGTLATSMIDGATYAIGGTEDAFYSSDIAGSLEQFGTDALAGFGQGMLDGVDYVLGIVESTAETVTDAFQQAFEISSPSRVMAMLVGHPLIEGIAQGMYDAFPLIDSALAGLEDQIGQAVSGIKDLVHGMISDILDANVSTSRQIVDNFDQVQRMADEAERARQRAADNVAAAQKAFNEAIATGDQARIDAARTRLQDANSVLSGALSLVATTQQAIATAKSQLAEAQAQATAIGATNAQAGADYLAMRSQQIFEMTELLHQQAEAQRVGNEAEATILAEKIILVKAAQDAELAQYQQHADDLAARLAEQAAQIAQQGADTGDGFMQGVIAGIANQTQALSDAMLAAVESAIAAMRAALGIASPSKVFAEQIGRPMMEGWAQGILGGGPMVVGAVGGVAGAAQAAAGQSITNTYYLNYETRQSSGSAAQDVQLLSLLYG